MADFVNREVARERLRKACKMGTFVSVLLLLAGLAYGGIAALVYTDTRVPQFVATALYMIVPTLGDTLLATAECATKAVLFFLIGLVGILLFHKVAKTGDAFRLGQMKQLRFIAVLLTLLGFLPSLVGNGIKIATALRSGHSALAVMSFAVDAMCIVAGLLVFFIARMLVAGANLGRMEDQGAPAPVATDTTFSSMPDLSQVPMAQTETASPYDAVDQTLEQPSSSFDL